MVNLRVDMVWTACENYSVSSCLLKVFEGLLTLLHNIAAAFC